MSGHSKWSQIKRQKGVADSRRGQLFTKLSKEIEAAVRQGGDNPEMNFRLRLAVQKARDSNMPTDNIERAIKRSSGGTEGANLIEATSPSTPESRLGPPILPHLHSVHNDRFSPGLPPQSRRRMQDQFAPQTRPATARNPAKEIKTIL